MTRPVRLEDNPTVLSGLRFGRLDYRLFSDLSTPMSLD